MKTASRFQVQPGWKLVLSDMGIYPGDALKLAGLPSDLFSRSNMSISIKEFLNLWIGVEKAAQRTELPLKLGESIHVNNFSSDVFASLCSTNMNEALKRLSEFKRLIGPMSLLVSIGDTSTSTSLECDSLEAPIPKSLGASEMVFIARLARIGTRTKINPIKVELTDMPAQPDIYNHFFGIEITQGYRNQIVFSREDCERPFLTENMGMWNFFNDELKTRLSELEKSASMSKRVKSVLMELLPSGNSSMEQTAEKLAISKRTLQRRLNSEGTNFQTVLQKTRQELAHHYLTHSTLSVGEISFLLAFKDVNSFSRAFSTWTGNTPGQVRQTGI